MMQPENLLNEWAQADEQLPAVYPIVSLYGSARLLPEHPACQQAERLSRRLSDAGFAVMSGGGPGIMEASNKGAFAGKSAAIGLNIELPHEQRCNPYQNISLNFKQLSARKAAFACHSCAFVVLTGGFGTLDELFNTLTLVQTKMLPPRPIILAGREFWRDLVAWIKAQLLSQKLIAPRDMDLLQVLDDDDEIIEAIMAQAA